MLVRMWRARPLALPEGTENGAAWWVGVGVGKQVTALENVTSTCPVTEPFCSQVFAQEMKHVHIQPCT